MRNARRPLTRTLVGVLVMLAGVCPAFAHATLVKSSPAEGAVLTQAPSAIEAVFSEELAVKGSVMRLYDAANTLLATGGVDLKDKDHESMKIVPPLLAAGAYTVRWHAISADDNHVTQDSFKFAIQGTASLPARFSMEAGAAAQRP